jgi:hypothetical protein
MELRIVAAPRLPVPAVVPSAPAVPVHSRPVVQRPQTFAAWLLRQTGRRGTLGALANAARFDPSFPKTGNADDVRALFYAAGADEDAFAALDDAEREWDRL